MLEMRLLSAESNLRRAMQEYRKEIGRTDSDINIFRAVEDMLLSEFFPDNAKIVLVEQSYCKRGASLWQCWSSVHDMCDKPAILKLPSYGGTSIVKEIKAIVLFGDVEVGYIPKPGNLTDMPDRYTYPDTFFPITRAGNISTTCILELGHLADEGRTLSKHNKDKFLLALVRAIINCELGTKAQLRQRYRFPEEFIQLVRK